MADLLHSPSLPGSEIHELLLAESRNWRGRSTNRVVKFGNYEAGRRCISARMQAMPAGQKRGGFDFGTAVLLDPAADESSFGLFVKNEWLSAGGLNRARENRSVGRLINRNFVTTKHPTPYLAQSTAEKWKK